MATVNVSSSTIISDHTAEQICAWASRFFADPENRKNFEAWQDKNKSTKNVK